MNESRLVFSTFGDNVCRDCGKRLHKCKCQKKIQQATNEGIHIYFEKKGRKGAGITIISGLNMKAAQLKLTTKNLKKYCGVGGSFRDGLIEIQGDQRDKSKDFLENSGYQIQTLEK